jgi:hypothetical protein
VSILTSETEASTPAADAARTPRWTDARDQMIHACALQEHIIAMAAVLPTSVKVDMRYSLAMGHRYTDGEFDVTVYVHQNPEAVRAYREFLGGEVTEGPNGTEADGRAQIVTELSGEMFGCSFRVHTLTSAVEL